MVVRNIIFSILLLEFIWVQALPEEVYQQYPGEDDDMYLYMDQRSESDPKLSETRRRSTLDKNFARFGRGDLLPLAGYDFINNFPETFNRQTRSGDKTDHFIRFGRDYEHHALQDQQQHLRFTRSTDKARAQRETDYKRAGSNFVRFGRNDNFMRFGRDPEVVNKLNQDPARRPHNASKNEQLLELLLAVLNKEHVRLN